MKLTNKISLEYKSILTKFSHGIILNIFLKIKGAIYVPILVNFLSKQEVGEISYVQAAVGLLSGLIFLNIPDSSNRIILSREDGKSQNLAINSFTNFSFLFGVFFLTIFIIITTIFQLLDLRIIFIISSMLFAALIDKLSKYVFQIFQNTKLLTIVTLTTEYTSLIIVCYVLYFELYNDILTILYIYSFCIALSSIYLFYILFKTYPFSKLINNGLIKKVLKISLFLFPASYSMIIIQSSDFIIIENILGLKKLGEYSFSYALAGLVSGLSMAVTFFWYSTVVYADKKQIERLIDKVLKISFGLLILITFLYFLFTETLIKLINPEYINTKNLIMILIVGFFMGILNKIAEGIMYADGNERQILFDSTFIALLNLLLNFLFIPKYGLKFAAFSTSLSFILLYFFRILYLRKKYTTTNAKFKLIYSISILFFSLTTIFYYLWI